MKNMNSLSQSPFYLNQFLVDPELNQISINNNVTRMEPKVTQTLLLLVGSGGKLVSREALLKHVWENQVVGEEVINRTIFQLRKLLNDKAKNPEYIATIPKKGYQFLASPTPIAPDNNEIKNRQTSLLPTEHKPWSTLRGLFALFVIIGSLFALTYSDESELLSIPNKSETYLKGREADASFSPDGKWMAFVHVETIFDNIHIYLKNTHSDKIIKLTTTQADDRFPVWSKDSQVLYFSRCTSINDCKIVKRHLVGGKESILYAKDRQIDNLTISYTENNIVFSEFIVGEKDSSRLHLLDLSSATASQLFNNEKSFNYSERHPVYHSNGSKLVYLQYSSIDENTSIIEYDFETKSSDNLLHGSWDISSFAFLPSSSEIYLSIQKDARWGIWSSVTGTNKIKPILLNNEDSMLLQPRLNKDGTLLTYQSYKKFRREVLLHSLNTGNTNTFVTSSQLDDHAVLSKSGNKIAFNSNRNGAYEIWIANADGKNQEKLTNLALNLWGLSSITWSKDDKEIAFTSSSNNGNSLFIVDSSSGLVKFEYSLGNKGNKVFLGWSADNNSFLIGVQKSNQYRIERLTIADSSWQVVTNKAGLVAMESAQGKYMYYHQYHTNEIRQLNLLTNEDKCIASNIKFQADPLRMPSFLPKRVVFTRDNFYFIDENYSLQRVNLKTSERTLLIKKVHSSALLSDVDESQNIIFYDKMTFGESEIRSIAL